MSSSSATLAAHQLRREFGPQRFVAVDDVSLSIEPGSVLAMLGPNGAGKTTTIKMLSTLLTPTSGSVVIDGIDAVANPRQARTKVGLVLGGERGFYQRASALDNLLFFADVLGVPRAERAARVASALETVSLTDRAEDRLETFSRGMLQRMHLARGLLNAPKLLLLDEPTSGLDPEIARDVRALVRKLAAGGTAILLTTHYLAEAEELADALMVIDHGTVIASGGFEAIAQASRVTHVTTFSLDPAEATALASLEDGGVARDVSVEQRRGRAFATLMWDAEPNGSQLDALRNALGGEHLPADAVTRKATLEESYLTLIDGEGDAA